MQAHTIKERLLRSLPVAVDLLLLMAAYYVAFALRFEGVHRIPVQHVGQFWQFLAILPLLRVASNAAWGIYRHVWRYVGMPEATSTLAATLTGSGVFALLVLVAGQGFPRSVIAIEFLLALVLCIGVRAGWRAWAERWPRVPDSTRRALIVGAGDAGEMLARDLVRHPDRGVLPVGFVDDSSRKLGKQIHGLEVFGTRDDIPRLVAERNVDLVVLAIPGASVADRRAIATIAATTPAQVKTIPSLHDVVAGRVAIGEMRNVPIEDLLGRDQVMTDGSLLGYLRGRRVLVSGAGGSIGSELCRQIAELEPALLVCLGHGENSIYLIEQELRARYGALPVVAAIADTRDEFRIRGLFQEHRPDVVFHAAAHKHVPLMEANEVEAVANNVLGTGVLARAAAKIAVERFVLVSTDKAVNPTSVMGKTKRLAELLIQDLASRSATRFVAVRFGNVLGSRGSVVPLFKRQIAAGGPVTVTHPEMRRFFMTIPEAVTLVLQAGEVGRQGEVLMLDMGAPVRIVDLARNLIRLSGLRPEEIEIAFTGSRPGEKLFEELLVTDEAARATDHPQIFAAKRAHPPDPNWWGPLLDEFATAVREQDGGRMRLLLDEVIGADQPRPGNQPGEPGTVETHQPAAHDSRRPDDAFVPEVPAP